jgi:hypothetical protein
MDVQQWPVEARKLDMPETAETLQRSHLLPDLWPGDAEADKKKLLQSVQPFGPAPTFLGTSPAVLGQRTVLDELPTHPTLSDLSPCVVEPEEEAVLPSAVCVETKNADVLGSNQTLLTLLPSQIETEKKDRSISEMIAMLSDRTAGLKSESMQQSDEPVEANIADVLQSDLTLITLQPCCKGDLETTDLQQSADCVEPEMVDMVQSDQTRSSLLGAEVEPEKTDAQRVGNNVDPEMPNLLNREETLLEVMPTAQPPVLQVTAQQVLEGEEKTGEPVWPVKPSEHKPVMSKLGRFELGEESSTTDLCEQSEAVLLQGDHNGESQNLDVALKEDSFLMGALKEDTGPLEVGEEKCDRRMPVRCN